MKGIVPSFLILLMTSPILVGQTVVYSKWIPDHLKIKTDSIVKEGFELYKLETAAWISTDYLVLNDKKAVKKSGGYLSYISEDTIVTIYFDKQKTPKILVTFKFNSDLKLNESGVVKAEREPSEIEKYLINMRQDALDRINKNTEGLYQIPEMTSLNLIPVLTGSGNKIVVMTGSKVSGIVPIGNDYQLIYSKKGEFVRAEQIHRSYIPTGTSDKFRGYTVVTATHTHIINDIISSTDICNLLLFKDKIQWKEMLVMGKDYYSIWDVKNSSLSIKTAWEYSKEK